MKVILTGQRGGVRGYDTTEEREADLQALRAEGFNHFVFFKDTEAELAMQFGRCDEGAWFREYTADPHFYYVDR